MTSPRAAEWRAAAHAALLAGAAVLTLPAGAAALPAGAGTLPAGAAAGEPAFAPPTDKPLMLSRTIVRELQDGAAIVATRRYQIAFRAVDQGWQVDGALIASDIAVPPSLAKIAAFERARPDEGLFPIFLDLAGRIVAAPPAALQPPSPRPDRKAFAAAMRVTSRVFPRTVGDGFLAQLNATAVIPTARASGWPDALFLPHGLFGVSEQSFRLPDGTDGSVLILLDSDTEPARATMSRARRTVITQIAGNRQVAREEWTLEPIAPLIGP